MKPEGNGARELKKWQVSLVCRPKSTLNTCDHGIISIHSVHSEHKPFRLVHVAFINMLKTVELFLEYGTC